MSKKITTGNWNVTNVLLAGLGMIACYGIVRLEISMSLSNIPLFSGITGFLVAYFSQVAGSRCNIVETSLVFVKSYIAIFIGFFSFHSLTSSLLLSLSYAVEAMAVWGLLAKAMGFTNVQDLSIMTVLASPFLIIAVPSTIASFCRYFIIENTGGGGYDSLLSPSQAMLLSWSADVAGLILLAPTILISFKKYTDYAPAINSKTVWILLLTTVASAIVPTCLHFLNAGFDSHLYTVLASLIITCPAVLYGGIIGLSLANATSLVLILWFLFLKPSNNYYVTLSTTLHTHDNHLILLYFYCIIQITGMVVLWVSLEGKLKLQAEKTAGQDLITMRIQQLKKENSEQEIRQIQYMRAICSKYMDVSGSPAIQDSNEMLPNPCASDILEYLLYLELKSKKLAIQSVATDLEDLLSTRIEAIYNMYKERGIKFKHEFNTMFDWIRVDPVRIEQVVLNVLMGPMQHLNPSNTLASTITIKSVTSNDEESTLAYFMEFVMHICGVTDVYSFKTKFERLLQHNPFQAKPDVHQYQSQESGNAGPEKLQHQELSIGENGSPHPRRLDETSISQDTLRLSSTNTLSSPFNIEEGKLTAAESAALSGDGEDLTTAPLSLAIAHDLTKLMNGNTSIITGIKRVTLHFRIPVEICSTAQVLSSASGGSSYGSNPRPGAAAAAAATAAAASWRYKRIGGPVSVPPSACNSPVNCVLDLFPGEVNSVQPIRRPSSILKEGSGPRRSSTVSKKTVRIQVAE